MKKKNRSHTWILLIVFVLIIAAGIYIALRVFGNDRQAAAVRITPLARTTLVDSISTKGVVESVNKRNVSSSLSYSVQAIYVEVGDRVGVGQTLCQLETEDLELNLAQQRVDLDVSQQNSLNQLENNQRLYDEAVLNLQNGANTQILNAESSLRTATVNMDNAQKNFNDAMRDRDEGKNAGVINAESSLNTAKLDMENKQRDLVNNKTLFEAGVVTRDTVTQLETAVTNAVNRYNDALEGLETAKLNEQRSIEQAENSLRNARTSYDNAQAALTAAKNAANQDLERYKNNIASSTITANMDTKLIAIQKLEKQLNDSTVTAPIAGTITAVYAKEGQPGSGLLFVIEDTDHLRVKTKIKEYDAGKVGVGMAVQIRSDATGDALYDGVITKINPAAEKTAQGETNTAGDIEFGAEISVDSPDTALKIGMNTRLTIIIQSKADVYCVPYDAVSTYNGERVVYVLSRVDRAAAVAQAIPVKTGMETDFYIEINSGELITDMPIINDAGAISDGMTVRLADNIDLMQQFR